MDRDELSVSNNIDTYYGWAKGQLLCEQYTLGKRLGGGGFTEVWQAHDKTTQSDVALKLLPKNFDRLTTEFNTIEKTYELISKVTHENIVKYLDLKQYQEDDRNSYFLVMEFIEGEDLGDYSKDKKLSLDEVCSVGKKIAAGLDCGHSNKIIHRDIKPQNIMIDNSGEVKIVDFGLAVEIRASMSHVSSGKINISAGTPLYSSPEQSCCESKITSACDQYSFAAVLYELIAGYPPFNGSAGQLLTMHASDILPKKIERLNKKANNVLLKALSKKPEDRFDNCTEFITEFEDAVNAGEDKNKVNYLVVCLIVTMLLGAGIWLYSEYSRSDTELKLPVFTREVEAASELAQDTPASAITVISDSESEGATQGEGEPAATERSASSADTGKQEVRVSKKITSRQELNTIHSKLSEITLATSDEIPELLQQAKAIVAESAAEIASEYKNFIDYYSLLLKGIKYYKNEEWKEVLDLDINEHKLGVNENDLILFNKIIGDSQNHLVQIEQAKDRAEREATARLRHQREFARKKEVEELESIDSRIAVLISNNQLEQAGELLQSAKSRVDESSFELTQPEVKFVRYYRNIIDAVIAKDNSRWQDAVDLCQDALQDRHDDFTVGILAECKLGLKQEKAEIKEALAESKRLAEKKRQQEKELARKKELERLRGVEDELLAFIHGGQLYAAVELLESVKQEVDDSPYMFKSSELEFIDFYTYILAAVNAKNSRLWQDSINYCNSALEIRDDSFVQGILASSRIELSEEERWEKAAQVAAMDKQLYKKLLAKAREQFNQGDYDGVVKTVNEIYAISDKYKADYESGKLLAEAEEKLAEYKAISEKRIREFDELHRSGDAANEAGDFELAKNQYAAALDIDFGVTGYTDEVRRNILVVRGKLAEAKWSREVEKKKEQEELSQKFSSLMAKGIELYKDGKYNDAFVLFLAALAVDGYAENQDAIKWHNDAYSNRQQEVILRAPTPIPEALTVNIPRSAPISEENENTSEVREYIELYNMYTEEYGYVNDDDSLLPPPPPVDKGYLPPEGSTVSEAKGYYNDFEYYLESALAGNAGSQFRLGEEYEKGNIVKQDYRHARFWYQLAADQGDALAQTNLDRLRYRIKYMEGKVVPRSIDTGEVDISSEEEIHSLPEKHDSVLYRNYVNFAKGYIAEKKWENALNNLRLARGENDTREVRRLVELVNESKYPNNKQDNLAATPAGYDEVISISNSSTEYSPAIASEDKYNTDSKQLPFNKQEYVYFYNNESLQQIKETLSNFSSNTALSILVLNNNNLVDLDVFINFKNIVSLKISSCDMIQNIDTLQYLPYLKELELSINWENIDDYSVINILTDLEVLDLGWQDFPYIPNLHNLVELTMDIPEYTKGNYPDSQLANLKELSIRSNVSNSLIHDLSKLFPGLKLLTLSRWDDKDTSFSLASLGQFKNLESISFISCDIPDDIAQELSKIRHLKRLDFFLCTNFDNNKLEDLKKKMPLCKITARIFR